MMAKTVASDPASKSAAGLKSFTNIRMVGRVPAVYLKLAFWPFVPVLPFRRINKLNRLIEHAEFDPPPRYQIPPKFIYFAGFRSRRKLAGPLVSAKCSTLRGSIRIIDTSSL